MAVKTGESRFNVSFMKMNWESLHSEKFKPISGQGLHNLKGGTEPIAPGCTGGGGERIGMGEYGPNGTVRYQWRMWTSDDRFQRYGVTYEWGPYYTP